MSQAAIPIATGGDGATVRSRFNSALQRLQTRGSGTARPSDIGTYEVWVETDNPGTGVVSVWRYDGTSDVLLGLFDTTNHKWRPATDGAFDEVKGADIASATTCDIGAATGNFVHVTGTTTITGLGTVKAGTRRHVKFTGALILTHHASQLILPTAANITTVAGDTATFISLGSGNWICIQYQRADGTALSATSALATPVWVAYATNANLTTSIPADDTKPQNTEGTQILSGSFTANSATNYVEVEYFGCASNATTVDNVCAALFMDSAADAVDEGWVTTSGADRLQTFYRKWKGVVAAGAHTWSVRLGGNGTTVRANGSSSGRYGGGTTQWMMKISEVKA